MKMQNRNAILALAAAGALWGLTVPLSKLSLGWLAPAWLTVVRFGVAAPLLALVGRRGLREALNARVIVAGAVGFGAVIILQNDGIERTSVTHAAMVVGAVPVLVALISAGLGQGGTRPRTWGGYALALIGIAFVAGTGGGGASTLGDLLVLASVILSAGFIAFQPSLLAGRDAAAVTAVQFATGALVALPVAVLTEGVPHAPTHPLAGLALVALALVGTPLPFWLFAFGQARVPAELAGAFVNLEPVVGAAAGWLAVWPHSEAEVEVERREPAPAYDVERPLAAAGGARVHPGSYPSAFSRRGSVRRGSSRDPHARASRDVPPRALQGLARGRVR
jgi:O-acetylserine/cysteine efflux transporter